MAFSASITNLSRGLMGQLTGVFINKYFVGVTQDNLSHYYAFTLIGFGCCIYEYFIIKLIPVQSEIDACILIRKEQRDSIGRQNSLRQSDYIN
mgnify:CR=1 FL=1